MLGTVGCQGREIVAGVGDSTFVSTMADLTRVQSDTTIADSARGAKRDSVLKHHGVTAEQIERAARALANDLPRAQRDFQALAEATGRRDTVGGRRPSAANARRRRGAASP